MANISLVRFLALSLCVMGVCSQYWCSQPQTFRLSCPAANCDTGWAVNGVLNGPITLTRGEDCEYTFTMEGNTYGRTFEIYVVGNNPRGGSRFPEFDSSTGTRTYAPQSNNQGNALTVGGDFWYAWCSSTNNATCPGAKVTIVGPGPINGQWSSYGTCTKACGGGQLQRFCNNPEPRYGGVCEGDAIQDVPCHTVPCGCKIDVAFVLDGSGSIDDPEWDQLKSFAKDLAGQLDISQSGNGSIAGVVQFSTTYRFETDFVMPPVPRLIGDLTLFDQVIDDMDKIDDRTAIGGGIMLGQQALVEAGRWSREPPIPKVILLITDGANNEPPEPSPLGRLYRANGTEIYVIAVGDNLNKTQLLDLASEPKEGVHYFYISGYDTLFQITNDLAYALCYSRGGAAPPTLYLLLLLLLPLAAGLGFLVFIVRRRKPKKVVAPPPEPEPEPVPVPVKAAAPAPIVDKPKDWTVPGTRYIGFGQANIKVKWGTDAPPSAPRGHDKYDRWSMQHGGGPMPPASPSGGHSEPMLSSPSAEPQAGAIAAQDEPVSCCARFCPCCLACAMGGGGAAAASKNRQQLQKEQQAEAAADEGNWQENTAATAAAESPEAEKSAV